MVIENLIKTVQYNCDIADAQHGTDYTMCTYLMKMREYFRWVKGYGFTDRLPKEQLGDWLAEREDALSALEAADFEPLEVHGESLDPFDADTINRHLMQSGLVYSSGLENCAKPHFYLARLESHEKTGDGFSIHISGQELARGLNSPPAMMRESSIFLRREALRRLMWERLETWRWNSLENPLGRAFSHYDFETDIETALTQMAAHELETVRQHEFGEYFAGELLGDAWNQCLLAVAGTPAELMMRAVRDHLADCSHTLPYLAQEGGEASIHFYVGNLSGMRKELFPAIRDVYLDWHNTGSRDGLAGLASEGFVHWRQLAESIVRLDIGASDLRQQIESMVNENRL